MRARCCRWVGVLVVGAALLGVGACGSGGGAGPVATADGAGGADAPVGHGSDSAGSDSAGSDSAGSDSAGSDSAGSDSDHTDVPGPAPFLDWAALSNPVLARPDRMLKDQAVVWHEGAFYVFASTRFEPEAPGEPVIYRTRDFLSYEELPRGNAGHLGSPDVSWDGERWVLVYQHPVDGMDEGFRRLSVTTSDDLLDWAAPTELLPGVMPDVRVIDGALARHADRHHLAFKAHQIFLVTRSLGPALDGRWEPPRPVTVDGVGEWAENYQLVRLDGVWHLLATARDPESDTGGNDYTGNHEPHLYTMEGDGSESEHWARWTNKRHLEIPWEDWNTVMHANSAFLCDWRAHDGWFYLFYAGANDDTSFQGRGHGKLGVARSRDLVTWHAAGEGP